MAEKIEVGKVSHYYTHLEVAIIEVTGDIKNGDDIVIEGATTSLKQKANSMQIDRKPIEAAKPGDSIGLKVSDRVREGDKVYKLVE